MVPGKGLTRGDWNCDCDLRIEAESEMLGRGFVFCIGGGGGKEVGLDMMMGRMLKE